MARRKSQRNKNRTVLLIGTVVVAVSCIISYFYGDLFGKKTDIYLPMDSDFTMTAYFMDVGQGDSTLFINNGHSVLIDSGEEEYADLVKRHCELLFIDKFDCIIVSHPHSDHAGGMAEIVRDIGADNIIIPDINPEYITSSFYMDFLDAAAESGANVYYAYPGDVYTFGDMTFTVIAPYETGKDLNNDSVVVLAEYEDISVLMTGDTEESVEKQIIENFPDLHCNVLKVGHHGSKTSSCAEFLDTVKPTDCVISVGAKNKYSHPNKETLDALLERGVHIFRTDFDGDVILRTNGNQYKIETEKRF